MKTKDKKVSNCCGAEVYTDCGDEGTCCYICSKCKMDCDGKKPEDKKEEQELVKARIKQMPDNVKISIGSEPKKETWEKLPDTNYEASNLGFIRNKKTKHILKSCDNNKGYRIVNICKNGKCSLKTVHRLVWLAFNGSIKEKIMIDHINKERWDNRLINLRLATRSQNSVGRRNKNGTSSFLGVSFDDFTKKNNWKSNIMKDGKNIAIGRFETEVEAAIAYDIKALELFNNYANFNFPIIKQFIKQATDEAYERGSAEEKKYWIEEARRYAKNAGFWQEKYEKYK